MGKPYALKNRMGLPSDEAAEIAPPHTLFTHSDRERMGARWQGTPRETMQEANLRDRPSAAIRLWLCINRIRL